MRVLLADFQFLTRQGIATLVDRLDDFDVVGQIDDPANLSAVIEELQPELVILDIANKGTLLIDNLERIKINGSPGFLVISNSHDRQSVQRLLAMGIKGIVTKNCSEEEITNAIRAVAVGNRFFCNNVLELVVNNGRAQDCEPTNLTQREYEVLKFIVKGKSSNQIADALHISIHTINSHRKNILKKLNLKSPAELIVYALESGLVS